MHAALLPQLLTQLLTLVAPLRALLSTGFVAHDLALLPGMACLLHPLAKSGNDSNTNAGGWIISQRLLALRRELASDAELLCALLAQHADLRASWLSLAAARCKEAGQMRSPAPLQELVSQLQAAASWVEAALPTAQLVASPFAALEREVLGVSFEQAQATPALSRLLAVAARLAQYPDALPALPLVDVTGMAAQQNWLNGRLLGLPNSANATNAANPSDAGMQLASAALLAGGFARSATSIEQGAAQAAAQVAEKSAEEPAMTWVLRQPWALLLAMLVYAQDIWQAEGRGGLLLHLPSGQNAYAPTEIKLVVVGLAGDEIACGSVADLLLASLAHVGMACFPPCYSSAELNPQLAPLVGLLLERQVWRYDDGASGEPGRYQIHPLFADACYRLPGSKVFHRHGRLLWQAIRISAEALYSSQRATSKTIA